MQFNAETQHHDPSVARQRLKFPTVDQRRARVAETFTNGQYDHPEGRYAAPRETFGTQTELQTESREIAVGEGDTVYEPPERVQELELKLPNPQDFPILTIAQLVEAEQRTLQLIRLLEAHIIKATQEENEALRIERVKRGELDYQRKKMLVSTEEYLLKMGERVELRLRRHHQDPDGSKLPSAWVHEKIADIPNSPSPHRMRTLPVKTMAEIGKDDGAPPPPPAADDEDSDPLAGTHTSIGSATQNSNASSNNNPTAKLGIPRLNVEEFVSSVAPGAPVIAPKQRPKKVSKWETFDLFSGDAKKKSSSSPKTADTEKSKDKKSKKEKETKVEAAAPDATPAAPTSTTEEAPAGSALGGEEKKQGTVKFEENKENEEKKVS